MAFNDDIVAALRDLRIEQGESVIYRRPSATTTANSCLKRTVQALIGSTLFRILPERGSSLITRSVDFLIGLEDLAFLPGGLPQEGDQIERRMRTRSEVYEVVRFNQEPCWRWSDAGHTQYRIHTKLIQAQTPATP